MADDGAKIIMRIDAHQHFWSLADRAGAWPPPELAAIYHDFLPKDLLPHLSRHGIAATVLVQSLPNQDDTQFLLNLSTRYAVIQAVVGWIDLKAADAPEQIRALATHSKLKGLRPMLQDISDVDWIADPALAPAIDAMQRHNLSLDALVTPRHLPSLITFADRYPALPLVIDHAAKPPIASGEIAAWKDMMTRLASFPQIHCKLSGLVTEAAPHWQVDDLQPYVDHVIAAFGASRVMWGSDWPVVDLAADYGCWIAATDALLTGLEDADRRQVLGLTAQRFYRIK